MNLVRFNRRFASVLVLLWACAAAAAPLGTLFTYQGQLVEGSGPANGSYDLTFALFNDPAAGAQVGTTQTNLSVAVSNGLFTTTIDFGAGLFDGTAYWLAIGVRSNGTGAAFTGLSPRQELTPTPYALYATTAPLADGSVTSAKILDGTVAAADLANNSVTSAKIVDGAVATADLADNSVTSAKVLNGEVATVDLADNSVTSAKILDSTVATADLANNSVTSAKIVDGTVATADLADNSVTTGKIVDGTILGADLANNTVTSAQLADSIDLGSTSVSGLLNVYRTAANTPSINLDGGSGSIRGYGSDGELRAALLSSSQFGGLYLYTTNGNLRAYMLANTAGSSLTLYQADGGTGVLVDGESSGAGLIRLYNTNASTRINLYGQSTTGAGGEIAVNDNSGTETVELLGQSGASTGAKVTLRQDSGVASIVLDGEYGSGEGGAIELNNTAGAVGLRLEGDSFDGGRATFYTADSSLGLDLHGESGGAGLINIYNTNSNLRIVLDGQSTGAGGEISVFDTSGTETIEILGAEDGTTGGQIMMRNASGTSTIQLDSDASGVGCGYIRLYKSNGVATVTIEADNAGDGRITTHELAITGGSDLSENFDIQALNDLPQPGMVVCIDAERPGELAVSAKPYDRTVAGVISGAGGVKPGLLMGQHGTKADGKHPVALTGRVFCLADAANGAIRPGDLLTTSCTPGHAMKVTNHAQAQGAIIGKAMTALNSGKGLVLVLVSLQ